MSSAGSDPGSPGTSVASSRRRAVVLLAVGGAAFFLSWFKVVDYDVFWHLKTGQVILDSGSLMRTNLFSALFPDHPWPNPEWLFQVLLASVYRAGGWFGIQVLKVSLVVALGVALAARALAGGARPLMAIGFAVIPLAAMRFRFQERPQLFSYLFFTLLVWAVERARRGERRTLWLLPPLFALWSNIHPELLLGLLYLGAVIAGELLQGRSDAEVPSHKGRAPLLAAVAAGCLLASLLNPEGYHVLTFPFLHLFLGPAVTVSEYLTTPLRPLPLYWAFVAVTIPALLLPRGRRDWADILPAAGFGILGGIYLRETPYFLLFAGTLLPVRLQALEGSGAFFTRRRIAALAIAATAAALIWAFRWDRLQPYRWGWGVEDDLHPVGAAQLLLAEPWQGNLYNHYEQGGYLILSLFPRYGVLQDGRVQAYPREFIARLNSRLSPEQWPKIVADYRLNLALVYNGEAAGFHPAEWGVVFWDDAWCLLARRTAGQDALLRKHEYRLFLPGRDFASATDPALLARMAEEMARNQGERLHPSPVVANNLGTILLRLGRRTEAEVWFRQAVQTGPDSVAAWTNLGLLLADAGRANEAGEALDRALRLDPGLAVVRARREMLRRP